MPIFAVWKTQQQFKDILLCPELSTLNFAFPAVPAQMFAPWAPSPRAKALTRSTPTSASTAALAKAPAPTALSPRPKPAERQSDKACSHVLQAFSFVKTAIFAYICGLKI